MIPVSVLDLSPIVQGGSAADALRNSLDLARRAERLGFRRYWVAEHHAMPGVASAATSVVIAHIAGGTSTIRVGSGGIMLPNHSPLVIAEQFGTLESLFPGRVDLAVGRAPGTDQRTARALRRNRMDAADTFPQDLLELQSYFAPPQSGQAVRAVPGGGLKIPIWLLGSSLFSAQLAASLGLPYAFAGHFAPAQMMEAFEIYRDQFIPSEEWPAPHTMAGLNITAADTDTEAAYLFTSMQQQFLNLHRGVPSQLPPPTKAMDERWTASERAGVEHALREAIVGGPETVLRRLDDFLERTRVDEIIVTSHIFDHRARLRSYEIVAEAAKNVTVHRAVEST